MAPLAVRVERSGSVHSQPQLCWLSLQTKLRAGDWRGCDKKSEFVADGLQILFDCHQPCLVYGAPNCQLHRDPFDRMLAAESRLVRIEQVSGSNSLSSTGDSSTS